MSKYSKKYLNMCIILLVSFIVWTYLIQTVDVKLIGESMTYVGFASINALFHSLTGVHMFIYVLTDWLSLVPVAICILFACIGLKQWIERRNLLKVDHDILLLGAYYIVVIGIYLFFERVPVNYRPILIEGIKEASYPSSTTLLVLSVMLTSLFQCKKRMKDGFIKQSILYLNIGFSVFMVVGRLISGVHWITDIIGSLMISFALYYLYKLLVSMFD